ncbi:MAG: DUF72 domain-containing protein [Candidatus Lokiarchaeota archaeon]|nr:DUF72 domain-containing protein [Candidatus Lokiarchaeota archaeon]
MADQMSPEVVFLGTSGYYYPNDWKGVVYPKNLKDSDMLEYYTRFFYSTEINSTFYNIPNLQSTEAWARRPLIYSAKIPKLITHDAKLDLSKAVDPFILFMHQIRPLYEQEKLLSLLLQLPPSFGKEEELHYDRMEKFAQYWQDYVQQHFISKHIKPPYIVVEFRHKNWLKEESFALLRAYGLVYCAVVEPLLPPRLDITNEDLFYIRFHGYGQKPWFNYNFSEEQLNEWAEKLNPIVQSAQATINQPKKRKVAIYFNNHFSGYAVKNALYLAQQMHLPHKHDLSCLQKPLYTLHDTSCSFQDESKAKLQKSLDDYF